MIKKIDKEIKLKSLITNFAIEIAPKATVTAYNKAWVKLCKQIVKLKIR